MFDNRILKCKAYSDGIPRVILTIEEDRRRPLPGDNGIQYEPSVKLVFFLSDSVLFAHPAYSWDGWIFKDSVWKPLKVADAFCDSENTMYITEEEAMNISSGAKPQ